MNYHGEVVGGSSREGGMKGRNESMITINFLKHIYI